VDEIPRASTLAGILPGFTSTKLCALNQDFFYYNVNNYIGDWNGPVMGTLDTFTREGGPQKIRNRRDSVDRVHNGGWHFSYFGGLERIKTKVRNFAHRFDPQCQDMLNRSDEEIQQDIKARNDLFHRPATKHPRRESNDPRLPKYYLENIDRFSHFHE